MGKCETTAQVKFMSAVFQGKFLFSLTTTIWFQIRMREVWLQQQSWSFMRIPVYGLSLALLSGTSYTSWKGLGKWEHIYTRVGATLFCYTLSNDTKSKVVTVQTIKGMGKKGRHMHTQTRAAGLQPHQNRNLKKKRGVGGIL